MFDRKKLQAPNLAVIRASNIANYSRPPCLRQVSERSEIPIYGTYDCLQDGGRAAFRASLPRDQLRLTRQVA